MRRIASTTGIPAVLLLVLLSSIVRTESPGAVQAQAGPAIQHVALGCVANNKFVTLTATVQPTTEIRAVRAYFRAWQFPEFYYVDMAERDGVYEAALPMPGPQTTRIVYYIEAVTTTYSAARTPDALPQVLSEDECKQRDPKAAYFPGSDPKIVVHGLTGAAVIPRGFLTGGIAGGIPLGTVIGIGAAAGGTAAVIGVVGGGEDTTTTVFSATSSVPTTTTSAPASALACIETSPANATINVNDSIRLDGSCSNPRDSLTYEWDLGDGRDSREGRIITPVYRSPGVYRVTLRVRMMNAPDVEDTEQKDVTVLAPPTTTVGGPGPGPGPTTTAFPDADLQTVSVGTPSLGQFTILLRNNGPNSATAVLLNFNVFPPGAVPAPTFVGASVACANAGPGLALTCNVGTLAALATTTVTINIAFQGAGTHSYNASVSGNVNDIAPGNNAQSGTVTALTEAARALQISFVSMLDSRDVQGEVRFNGAAVDRSDGSGPRPHHFRARVGDNVVEATAVLDNGAGALWRFDFSGDGHFEPGSIVVESGEAVSQGSNAVVFSVGEGNTRVRFRFRLRQ